MRATLDWALLYGLVGTLVLWVVTLIEDRAKVRDMVLWVGLVLIWPITLVAYAIAKWDGRMLREGQCAECGKRGKTLPFKDVRLCEEHYGIASRWSE